MANDTVKLLIMDSIDLDCFLEQNGYLLSDSQRDGRILIYDSMNYELKIFKDLNGLISVDIRTKFSGEWIQICLLRSYILKNDDYLKPTTFDTEVFFLVNYYFEITQALDKKKFSSTVSALKKLMDKRAKFLFGI